MNTFDHCGKLYITENVAQEAVESGAKDWTFHFGKSEMSSSFRKHDILINMIRSSHAVPPFVLSQHPTLANRTWVLL